jgi:hypothetical protein
MRITPALSKPSPDEASIAPHAIVIFAIRTFAEGESASMNQCVIHSDFRVAPPHLLPACRWQPTIQRGYTFTGLQ